MTFFGEYGLAALVIALCTGLSLLLNMVLMPTDLVMVYLVGTMLVALRGRRGPAVFASLLAVLCFNFFFVPPRFTLAVAHPQYLLTFLVMFAVAMTISHLALGVRTQAEAAKKAELAAETERLRSSLLSAVSHDLRTPLAAILGSADTLLHGTSAEKSSELLGNIRDEAERLSRLVHNLVETTRLESGGTRLKKELYPVEEVLGTALERLQKPLAGREVRTDLPEDLPPVPLDAVLMELVFVNLIENAAHHTPAKTPIDLSARAADGWLTLTVADRGPGVEPADLDRIFEKFYRAQTAAGGAGLGLAICKAVVEAHGGDIRASNREEGGAAFTLRLPLNR
ncbi:MAG: DUF4118 domain-containing protein [Elusimicrobia bacterium]|nr:DUF4118 domain-containing protein [Elusimicrobiota bacterium]